MCNKNRSIIKNKDGRYFERFYVCMLHTAASVAVLKLVMYIQAVLCPEEYVMLEWEYSLFSAVIILAVVGVL